jgi:hypothetical protein
VRGRTEDRARLEAEEAAEHDGHKHGAQDVLHVRQRGSLVSQTPVKRADHDARNSGEHEARCVVRWASPVRLEVACHERFVLCEAPAGHQ